MELKDEDTGDESPESEDLPPTRPDLRVGFILMNQFTLVPVAGLVDSLRFAADKSFRSRQIYCKWDWMTCNDQPIAASCGMPILPTKPLEQLESYDYIVLAGGLLGETRDPPSWLLDALRKVHAAGVPIVALCSGSFVLGRAGLLDGRRCAIHFTIREEFLQRFPSATALVDKSYVDDGGIITCPGGTAIDLAANMIRRHCGEIRAQKGLKYLLADTALEKAPESQPDAEPHVYQNEIVWKAIAFMRANLGSTATLKEVADHAGTSPRQLNRAFLNNTNDAPANYWRKLRLEHARKQLADTSRNVTTIAIECGFSDASHFILWFRKQYGETPSAYRKRRHEVERLLGTT
ncbi:AraC family transcriptional regulator [Caballeronia pedi]|uniref:AraC family transcriptional regulator n=1 Tax=Caballeronia pedi TaxID=1777141 RepID=A0A158BS91_9BURK|nr:GlxA family transcriptional regulator [Caballeronia pedi]SAK72851.1 AraC family transcriptional regulator [Caballeronia pedi]